MASADIHIGTSGWNYDHWKGRFYPGDLSRKKWLSFYTNHFSTVEINNSFYRLPEKKTFESWRDTAPPGFRFAVKGSRYITHMKKLKDPEPHIDRLMDRASHLKTYLGPIVFQLPGNWQPDLERLRAFLHALPGSRRFAIELRNKDWYEAELFDLLSRHDAALCIHDMDQSAAPHEVTADFVYIRLHGSGDTKYQGEYGRKGLTKLADEITDLASDGTDVYCYFNNDQNAYAVQDAILLKEMVDES